MTRKKQSEKAAQKTGFSKERTEADHDSQQFVHESKLKALNHIKKGELKLAESIYVELINHRNDDADILANYGLLLMKQHRFKEALVHLQRSVQLNSKHYQAWNSMGSTFRYQERLQDAIKAYQRAISLNPRYGDAWNNLGISLRETGQLQASMEAHRAAINLNSAEPAGYELLGITQRAANQLSDSIKSYKHALSLKPNSPKTLFNLGNALHESGDFFSARRAYEKSLELNPDQPDVHNNLSISLLMSGQYEDGWKEYRWRFGNHNHKPIAIPDCPLWPEKPLKKGEHLLLVAEQGLGDTLQFIRYASLMQMQGLKISICCDPKLHYLIRLSEISTSPLSPEEVSQLQFDHWMPLLSIGEYLNISPEGPSVKQPYLSTSSELKAYWQHRLGCSQKPIIAVNWQGNPLTETNFLKGRSIPLNLFAPLAELDVSLLSLQKGHGMEQLASCQFRHRFTEYQDQINETWCFAETAAILQQCDLLITSDTALAHLSGGLGLPTWLLLKHTPDWRWGPTGQTTFWYPTMRLFRQSIAYDWSQVMMDVKAALQEWCSYHPKKHDL